MVLVIAGKRRLRHYAPWQLVLDSERVLVGPRNREVRRIEANATADADHCSSARAKGRGNPIRERVYQRIGPAQAGRRSEAVKRCCIRRALRKPGSSTALRG